MKIFPYTIYSYKKCWQDDFSKITEDTKIFRIIFFKFKYGFFNKLIGEEKIEVFTTSPQSLNPKLYYSLREYPELFSTTLRYKDGTKVPFDFAFFLGNELFNPTYEKEKEEKQKEGFLKEIKKYET